MKKLVLCGITLVTLFGLTGCATSFNTSYDKAIVRMPNDEVVELKIDSVRYDNDQLQIKTKDGKIYLIPSRNCVLVKNKER